MELKFQSNIDQVTKEAKKQLLEKFGIEYDSENEQEQLQQFKSYLKKVGLETYTERLEANQNDIELGVRFIKSGGCIAAFRISQRLVEKELRIDCKLVELF